MFANQNLIYRPEIDGLRAFAVISVILYHSGFEFLSGGYVGVDIFFVISGYLITGIVIKEVLSNTFTFKKFYRRRVARLLPSLIITLLLTLSFGFVFYDTVSFDSLGKDVFYSALGAANILFAQGENYFAQDESIKPLVHLWSLGVEEQFYLLWPLTLLVLVRQKYIVFIACIATLFFLSLCFSIYAANNGPVAAYFLPQYRAFELILGALVFIFMQLEVGRNLRAQVRTFLSVLGFLLMIIPMIALDEKSVFPGINALIPCIGAGLFIGFSCDTRISRIFCQKGIVYVGLISYPLYLYHQPIISFIKFFEFDHSAAFILTSTLIISMPLASLTYRFIETPIRAKTRLQGSGSFPYVVAILVLVLSILSLLGLWIAKSGGVPNRFSLLNPFAHKVSEMHASTFHESFQRGYQLSDSKDSSNILFIGDSVLQHYVVPMARALGIEHKNIDTATRGGCVLLKGVAFRDKISDVSCDSIRRNLYDSEREYDYIVISQDWDSYNEDILNADSEGFHGNYQLSKWTRFIENSIQHFEKYTDNIIFVGQHLSVSGTSKLKPNITLSVEKYNVGLSLLTAKEIERSNEYISLFERFSRKYGISVIHPVWLFCEAECVLHDGNWSYFSDSKHLSTASTEYVTSRLKASFLKLNELSINP